jgi:hypothetical protein
MLPAGWLQCDRAPDLHRAELRYVYPGLEPDIFPDYLFDFFSEEQAVLDGNNAGGYVNPEFEELAGAY